MRKKLIIHERDNHMWQNYVNAILGLWVIAASYLYVPSGSGRVLMLITGIVVAILGFWGGAEMPSESGRRQMQS